jgi:hypothetical protein
MKHYLLVFALLAHSPSYALLQKAGNTGCQIDLPADWKVTPIGSSLDAKSKADDAAIAVTKGYGGLESAKASWKALLKVKLVVEDSKERWWVEVEPDKAHAGMQSFAVFSGDASQSCMVNLHARPSAVAVVKSIAGSIRFAP